MQNRLLLLILTSLSLALAGCAENTTTNGQGDPSDVTPPTSVPSTLEANSLFGAASKQLPDRFGMNLKATKDGAELMAADAVFENATKTAYFSITMDPSVLEQAGGGGASFGDPEAFRSVEMFVSPAGNVFLVNGTAIVAKPDEGTFDQAAGQSEGFGALMDPESMMTGLGDDNFTVLSVSPTVLRGKPALKLDGATNTTADGMQNVTVYLFQSPTRIARVEAVLPASDQESFAGAKMEMDILYDAEVTLQTPASLTRALSLRYDSDRNPFSFGGDEGPETWTFNNSGGPALAQIRIDVGDFDAAEPTWSMELTEGTKTQDGVTLVFVDVDADGKVSKGDTLSITRDDSAAGMQVSIFDKETGIRVVPAAGVLFAALAIVGCALVLRRR